jgi:signal transduction histidine kinase
MSSTGKANAALAVAVSLLLVCSCAAYFTFARMRNSQGWIEHTRQVQSALGQFSTNVTRASRLRAEYVDSGEPALLERQTAAVVEVRNSLNLLQRLTSDNVLQRANCGKLTELTEQRILLMDRSIAMKKSGASTLLAQVPLTRQIIASADAMDELAESMYSEEEGLLAQRQARERSYFSAAVAILMTSLFLALVLFLIHHQLLTEQVRERAKAEATQRALAARLLNVQDEERRKFARELHDSVGQHLAAIKMGVSILGSKTPGDAILQDCLRLLDDAIAETRTISHLLHPPLLDEAGLKSASRWFVEGFGQRSGIDVHLEIPDTGERLTQAIELALFRVLQESLTNVHRHSKATRADVSLNTSGNSVILRVKDNGTGMPAEILQNLRQERAGAGVGLAGMTERIRETGGRLEIHSSAAGTEIVARVPIRYRPPHKILPLAVQEVGG